MAEINFQIDSTALQTIRDTDLKANFEETKLALTEVMHPYTQLIVSEDGIASAKADRARINKIKTNIDSYRKMVKAAYNEPYKRIEEKFKELTAVCDQGIANIDYQLAEFEERRKEEKFILLKAHYEAARMSMDNPEYITSSLALHPKWENKTTSLEECQKYMDEAIQKVDTEVKTIRNLHSQWETSLLDDYSKNHDILSALALNERLTEKAQQEAERKRREQEERERRQAELERQREEEKETIAEATQNTNWETELKKAISEDQMIAATITIFGTESEIDTALTFLFESGLNFTWGDGTFTQ